MPYREKHYLWTWEFGAPREALWPLVSDTNRFNRDCGLPPFEVREPLPGAPPAPPGVRRLRSRYLGIVGEWEERQFEWVEPVRFTVERLFSKGPLDFMIQSCSLESRTGGGTLMTYEIRVRPKGILGAVIVPLAIGLKQRKATERTFRAYDRQALEGIRGAEPTPRGAPTPRLSARVEAICGRLRTQAHQPAPLVDKLASHVVLAEDTEVWRMRPYALADSWGSPRRETLDLFLHATRAGLLDFSWQVLCPHCRGSTQGRPGLASVTGEDHCTSCGIDFTVNFEQSVELTFLPNPTIRTVVHNEYCLGSPRITPHIVAQKRLAPGEELYVAAAFPEGRYRLRTEGAQLQTAFRLERAGASSVLLEVGRSARAMAEPTVDLGGVLHLRNTDDIEHLAVIERVAWSDQAVTAAAVTSRQVFRDLFSREVLRPGERISVGSMTIVFTDLRNSTQLYRDIGDATAFGRVMSHFDVIRAAVAEEGGTLVKTMGDAVMAAFTEPAGALRAMAKAQTSLASPENARSSFALKCAIHTGPCLAVTQNDRLDYFGTTVNVCSRLCGLSSGAEIIASDALVADPEVAKLLAGGPGFASARDSAPLKGVPGGAFGFWRLTPAVF